VSEASNQPLVGAAQQRRPLVVRDAPRHPAGERGFFSPFGSLYRISVCPNDVSPQLVTVNAARSDPPMPRARAAGRAAAGVGAGRSCKGEED
jgi:hypothetical protein